MALKGLNNLDGAIAALRKATDLEPDYFEAHNNLANALHAQGKFDEAVAAFNKAIWIKPDSADVYHNLGVVLIDQDNPAEAVAAYRRAIDLKPYFDSYVNLGIALYAQEKAEEASAAWRTAIDLNSQSGVAHSLLGQALLAQGKYAEAREATRRALELLAKHDPRRRFASEHLKQCEGMMALEKKLPDILTGKARPADVWERLLLADICARHKKLYAAAARFYAEGLQEEPDLVRDPGDGLRYAAAFSAALAGCGQGEDAVTLEDQSRALLRQQALTWLKADLTLWQKLAAKADSKIRGTVRKKLKHWQEDTKLACVRDREALAKLPEAERDAWAKLWDDVAATLKKASEPK